MKDKSGYQIRKENHICVNCGEKVEGNHVRCKKCRKIVNERNANRLQFLRENKLCLDCKAPVTRGARCEKCKEAARIRKNGRYKYCRENGLCVSCMDVSTDGKVFCSRCREIYNAKSRGKYKDMSPEQKAKKIAYAKAYQKAHPDKKKEYEKRFREKEKTRYEY